MDAFGDPADRDPINAFVELLWKRGTAFEDEVIADLSGKIPFVNLRSFAGAEKERKTLEAMRSGAPLIYGGRLAADDLLGDPDMLRRGHPSTIDAKKLHNLITPAGLRRRSN
jgi:hypothetical protein